MKKNDVKDLASPINKSTKKDQNGIKSKLPENIQRLKIIAVEDPTKVEIK